MRLLTRVMQLSENLTVEHQQKCKHKHIHLPQRRFKATMIDGSKRANIIQEQLRQEVTSLQEQGFNVPHLTTLLIGDCFASHMYIKRKILAAKAVGISTNIICLEKSIEEIDLLHIINSLNKDKNVHGILVQLPLPTHICKKTICNAVTPEKDVDGFSISNFGKFLLDMDSLWPCTALAVQDLIQSTGIETKGKHAVVCGRSRNVGLPIAMILQSSGTSSSPGLDATTTVCHRFTPYDQLCQLSKSADILVSATGVPGLITSAMVKPGACVIDVGITRVLDSKSSKTQLIGDVKFDEVYKVAGFLTPVPGGVGPMTVAMLLRNTLKAAKQQMRVCQ